MKINYSIEEILDAVNDLQKNKSKKKMIDKTNSSLILDNTHIPVNTLKLIEEAEKTIKLKLQSE